MTPDAPDVAEMVAFRTRPVQCHCGSMARLIKADEHWHVVRCFGRDEHEAPASLSPDLAVMRWNNRRGRGQTMTPRREHSAIAARLRREARMWCDPERLRILIICLPLIGFIFGAGLTAWLCARRP